MGKEMYILSRPGSNIIAGLNGLAMPMDSIKEAKQVAKHIWKDPTLRVYRLVPVRPKRKPAKKGK